MSSVTIARRSRLEGAYEWLAATDRFLLGRSGTRRARTIVVLDLDSLEVLWSAPEPRGAVHAWQGLMLLSLERTHLVLRDGRTGREEARALFKSDYALLHAWGDRAFVAGPHTSTRLAGVELGARFGEQIWFERQAQLQGVAFGGQVALLRDPGAGHQARRLEDGSVLWRSRERGTVRAMDENGVLVLVRPDRPPAPPWETVEYDLETGRVKWRDVLDHAPSLHFMLGPDVVVTMAWGYVRPNEPGVIAFSRTDGRRLWVHPVIASPVAWARAGDQLYVVSTREKAATFGLTALDLARGKTRFTMSEAFESSKGYAWTLVPAKRDLLVLVSHAKEGVTHVWRFGGN